MVKDADKIISEARKWLGTPYRERQRRLGQGVDCAGLIVMCGRAVKSDLQDLPNYSGEPTQYSLRKILRQRLELLNACEPGAIIEMKIFKNPQHLGIVTERNTFIHANMSVNPDLNKVIETRIDSQLITRINGYWTYRWQ